MADQITQEIKDRLDVAELIGGYIQVKKAGVNFKALCPFHNEKTPSMQISTQKQIWHCFGCGEGGDIFSFVQKYENVDFKEAIKLLADKAGVKLPNYRPPDAQAETEKDLLYRINDFAARYYHQILIVDAKGKEALQYLKNRGLNLKTIEKWQIGFAPDDFHGLEQALNKKKINSQLLVKAGVSVKNERGQVYDRFRGRITFPIFDYFGKVVGFSARILKDDGKSAKYVNSSETAIYSKSKILFGLNFAKESARKKDEMVIVEGQMDCISSHQAGILNVVASSGTAFTKEQLGLLGRVTKNLKFCFDTDTAGQTASNRIGQLALREGFRLKIILLEKVKDPDELIKKSPGLWEKAILGAKWFLDFQMDTALLKFSDPIGQKHFLTQEVIPLLSSVTDPLEQDHYLKQLSIKFGISERVVLEEIKKQLRAKTVALPAQPILTNINTPKSYILEKEVLGGMLYNSELLSLGIKEFSGEDFQNQEVRAIFEDLKLAKTPGNLKNGTVAKEALFMVESMLDNLEGNTDALKKDLHKSFSFFKKEAIKRLQIHMEESLRLAESQKDTVRAKQIREEFAALTKQRSDLEKKLN